MKLADYLSSKGLSHSDFAKRIGVSQAAVTRYANDLRMPRRGVLLRIGQETDGAVTFGDFLDLEEARAS